MWYKQKFYQVENEYYPQFIYGETGTPHDKWIHRSYLFVGEKLEL